MTDTRNIKIIKEKKNKVNWKKEKQTHLKNKIKQKKKNRKPINNLHLLIISPI